jgi:hypothetical protein
MSLTVARRHVLAPTAVAISCGGVETTAVWSHSRFVCSLCGQRVRVAW